MNNILNKPAFLKELISISEQLNEPYEAIHQEAADCLKELHTQHQPLANVIGLEFAQYILFRGYQKTIDTNSEQIKTLTKLARQHPIAFVMTHKTYLDMFVLAIVLARHGIPLPSIFAGVNLDLMGIGQLARQNGVIFIRRSFKDDLIYKAALRHFIASLLDEGAHFMWAVEGTRSRTGKLVWPKMGILKYIREAEQQSTKQVKYVPVSIVYDLIPDVEDMTAEGRDINKTPESLSWFVKYVRRMNHNLGKISLRFGPPVEVKDKKTVAIIDSGPQAAAYKGELSQFAIELVHKINKITAVTTASLVCAALLAKFSLNKGAIENDVADLMNLIEQYSNGTATKYVLHSANYLQATYYSNMSVHHLYKRAFIELAFLRAAEAKQKDREETFWQTIIELRNLFKFEFFYSRKLTFVDEVETLLNILDKNWLDLIKSNKKEITAYFNNKKTIVAPVVLQNYIEAYRVVAFALKNRDRFCSFDEKDFINDCVFLSEELHWQGVIHRIESIRKPFLINGVRLAQNLDIIPDEHETKTNEIDGFLDQLNTISEHIKWLQSITLSKPTVEISEVPLEKEIVPGSKLEGITKAVFESEKGKHIGAFFDLDKTLISSFSAKNFAQSRLLSGKATAKEIVSQFAGVIVYALGSGNFAGLAAVSVRGVKGIKEEVFIELGENVYQKHLANEIYPESRALVNAHLAQGHTVAIISAATPYQVNPVARDLNIEHIMCTRMEVKGGKFTGKIIDPACWGEGKALAAKELAEKHQLDLSKSYFYTDSHEDMPLMEIVGKPRPVNPDAKLSAMAFKNGWPVYRFSDEDRASITGILRTGLAMGSLFPAAFSGLSKGLINYSWQDGTNALMATVGDLVTAAAGIEMVVKGEEHLWSQRPAVFIFNHQSNTDLFIVSKLIRKNATGIAKKELKMMPVIGQLMTAAGVIFIDRKNKEKAIEAMQPAVDKDYSLGNFKKGAFHLAMQAGVPIVPVIIRNAHDAMPRGSNLFRSVAIDVLVLPPIQTKRWKKERLDFQINKIRNMYLKELKQGKFSDAKANGSMKKKRGKPKRLKQTPEE